MAEAAKLLSASDADKFDSDAHSLLKAVYQNPAFPIALRTDCAKAALRIESPTEDESAPRYVCIMSPPIPDLAEWRRRYMEEVPNASPEDQAWAERVAKAALEKHNALENDRAKNVPPWLDGSKGDES
jgi:hypothetical protein